ncbi:MAG TPA: GH1 family beta-glucosidase [Gemmatimonadaceae bacterium]|nr:GH1 family beta-glucosidase [Gemmatimonadaceae bacterium]
MTQNNNQNHQFPPDFLWGVATSAYQYEGSPLVDDAGENIWHRYCRQQGRILNGDTGDVACDFYNRVCEDIALADEIGVKAWRLSIGWARVLPHGVGKVNPKGIAFYDRLIDRLLARNITPFVTLYHWDMPQALEERGGWLNDDVASWLGEMADVVTRAFHDRVPFWATINEPGIITEKAYVTGVYAPGHTNPAEAPIVARNLLRAHGTAVQAARATGVRNVGIVVNLKPKHPATDDPQDAEAARRADAFRNRQFLDPILLGTSPEELPVMFGSDWRPLSEADLALAHQAIDFVGINYYTRNIIRHDPTFRPTRSMAVHDASRPHTLMGWEVYPEGMYEVLTWAGARYRGVPLYITENGAAFADPVSADGSVVQDSERVTFLRRHLESALRARADGVDLRGYFIWSLLDNFEWNSGYARPFGLYQVDFATQQRTPKSSARYYAEVIQSGLPDPPD